jgi:pyruvate/2-oxoacid:ferredoxin oxidoreductase alpha subunit
MEPLELDGHEAVLTDTVSMDNDKPWALKHTRKSTANPFTSLFLDPDGLEAHASRLQEKYKRCQELEMRHELYMGADADVMLVGYGIVSRVLRSVVNKLRAQGLRVGLFRPITLWPFPSRALAEAVARCRSVLVVELSEGQMVEDVRLAVNGKVPVEFYGRIGGQVPSEGEIERALADSEPEMALETAFAGMRVY